MKCPYCAEEIEDEAIVCRYCRHDLTFFKLIRPLQDRLFSLEDRVTELSATLEKTNASLDDVRSRTQGPITSPPHTSKRSRISLAGAKDHLPLRSRVLVVLLVGLLSSGWIVVPLLISPGPTQYTALLFLAIPVLGGLRVATAWRGQHLKSYVLLGLMAGILATLVSTAVGAFIYISPFSNAYSAEPFLLVWWRYFLRSSLSLIEVFSTTMLFITGGLIGDRIERMRSTKPGGPQEITEIQESARTTARGMAASNEGGFYRGTVKILKLLQPFAPVVTAVLGIIGPILLYILGI